ncbi:type II secretion system protein N [Brevundimonas sp. 2R-24]|uniref:Type II secretion system protein N n=1 Tax=Peiella sedimenti TaxID=3061083 RepID=A0ABT8SJ62_9CAUL|nr:type II secretion system protein N [Caulobacteraceae bacterium XZ-24]
MFRVPLISSVQPTAVLRRLAARPRAILGATEAVLAVALAGPAAALIWMLAGDPAPMAASIRPTGPDAADVSVLGRFDPFYRTGRDAPAVDVTAPSEGAGAQGFRLFGVRTEGGGRGSAIIAGPDGQQRAVRTGEEAAPGVILQSVTGESATLRAGGRVMLIAFEPSVAAAAPNAAPQTSTPSATVANVAATADRSALMRQLSLTPRRTDGRLSGMTLQARGGAAAALRRAGLEPGDVITAVNGQPVTQESLAELQAEMMRAPQAELTLERGGQSLTVQLPASPQ